MSRPSSSRAAARQIARSELSPFFHPFKSGVLVKVLTVVGASCNGDMLGAELRRCPVSQCRVRSHAVEIAAPGLKVGAGQAFANSIRTSAWQGSVSLQVHDKSLPWSSLGSKFSSRRK